jgi:hypothetical protein
MLLKSVINLKTQNKNNIAYNGWVYEKVCLDELSNTTNADSKLSYTPCYKYVLFLFYLLKNILWNLQTKK